MGRAVERQERAAPLAGKERRMWGVRGVSAGAVPARHPQMCVRAPSLAQQPSPGIAWLTVTLLRVGDPSGALPLRIPSHRTGLWPARNLDFLALGSH